jgi:ectoine hydroxylase-related dioxygenase (phytanoyl-CoA dioxygenase family)
MSESLKVPNGYFGLGAHQDWPSMQGSLDSLIVWAPLVDIDKDLYPLELVPGSHKNGLIKSEVKENYSEIEDGLYTTSDFIPVEVQKGDVIFMSSFTVHRSSIIGHKNKIRLACSLRYENMQEDTYVDRGFPTAYQRSVQRNSLLKGFPDPKKVKSIFDNG